MQYASADYVDRLASVGVRVSMSAVGNPYDNAKAESFFKTLKCEEVYLQQYRTFDEAEANLDRFIEDVYNAQRLHSASATDRRPSSSHPTAQPGRRDALRAPRDERGAARRGFA